MGATSTRMSWLCMDPAQDFAGGDTCPPYQTSNSTCITSPQPLDLILSVHVLKGKPMAFHTVSAFQKLRAFQTSFLLLKCRQQVTYTHTHSHKTGIPVSRPRRCTPPRLPDLPSVYLTVIICNDLYSHRACPPEAECGGQAVALLTYLPLSDLPTHNPQNLPLHACCMPVEISVPYLVSQPYIPESKHACTVLFPCLSVKARCSRS